MALETLTIKIGRLLGLEFVGWRVRGQATGGSEVDVVMDDIGTIFNRVQIQCKNIQAQLEAKHVAREVGLSRMIRTNTILMIARGGVSADAKQYANQIMQLENISIMFIHGDKLDEFDDRPDQLLATLQGESRRIHGIKRLESREETTQEAKVDEAEVIEEYEEELEEFQSRTTSLSEFSEDG